MNQFVNFQIGESEDPYQRVLPIELVAVEETAKFVVEEGKVFLDLASAEVWSEIGRCIHLPTALRLVSIVWPLLIEPYHSNLFGLWALEADAEADRFGALLLLNLAV